MISKIKAKGKSTNGISPSQSQVDNLLLHYQSGRYVETEKLAVSITEQFPSHPFGWKALGAVLGQTGKNSKAVNANYKAVTLFPKDAVAHNNLGNTLLELGRLEEAEASLRQAISLKPDNAVSHSNLGVTLQELGRLEEAKASYTQAIVLKPDYTLAIYNLSVALDYMNNLDEAVLLSEKVLEIDSNNDGLRAAINLAIFRFLEGDFSASKLVLLKWQKIQKKSSLRFVYEKIFHTLLLKILNWHESQPPALIKHTSNKKLYVIGESHSLSSHGLQVQSAGREVLCQSFFIKGCKQSDLGSDIKNQYKHKFEDTFRCLPEFSVILLAIGEIDCRLDSGMMKHRKKYPEKNMVEIIKTTVENYINYIFELNSDTGHDITIQGVPCPNIDTTAIPAEKVLELIDMVREFNVVLKNKSNEVGFGFLDVHKLTDNGNGFSNSIWNLDDYHLSPEGMQEAWREHATL